MLRSNQFTGWSGGSALPGGPDDLGRTWAEHDALGLTWADIDALQWDWYLWLYGGVPKPKITSVTLVPNPVAAGQMYEVSVEVEMVV